MRHHYPIDIIDIEVFPPRPTPSEPLGVHPSPVVMTDSATPLIAIYNPRNESLRFILSIPECGGRYDHAVTIEHEPITIAAFEVGGVRTTIKSTARDERILVCKLVATGYRDELPIVTLEREFAVYPDPN